MSITNLLTLDARITPVDVDEERDDYNDEQSSAGSAFDTKVWAVPLEQGENTGAENVVTEGLKCFLLPDVSVKAADRISVLGHVFEFDGDPHLWRNPRTGVDSHQTAILRRVT